MSDSTPRIEIVPQYGPVAGHPGFTFTCSECPSAGRWTEKKVFAQELANMHLARDHGRRNNR